MKITMRALALAALTTAVSMTMGCEGRLSVSITDTPIDDAARVVINVVAVNVKPNDDSEESFTFDPPRPIDLLEYQGRNSLELINESLDEGNYDYIELEIEAEEGELDSFIEFSDGSQRSLKLDTTESSVIRLTQAFELENGETNSFTIDFDLHASIFTPTDEAIEDGDDDYLLRPSLRIIENSDAASISGTILQERATATICVEDDVANSGKAVYLYSGEDAETDDFGSANAPISAALVTMDIATGAFSYEFGFLEAGSYTLAFTCQSKNDEDGIDNDNVEFTSTASVELEAEENLVQDL